MRRMFRGSTKRPPSYQLSSSAGNPSPASRISARSLFGGAAHPATSTTPAIPAAPRAALRIASELHTFTFVSLPVPASTDASAEVALRITGHLALNNPATIVRKARNPHGDGGLSLVGTGTYADHALARQPGLGHGRGRQGTGRTGIGIPFHVADTAMDIVDLLSEALIELLHLPDVHRIGCIDTRGHIGNPLATTVDTIGGHAGAACDRHAGITDRGLSGRHTIDVEFAVHCHLHPVVRGLRGDVLITGDGHGVAQAAVDIVTLVGGEVHAAIQRLINVAQLLINLPQLATVHRIGAGFADLAAAHTGDNGVAILVNVALVDVHGAYFDAVEVHIALGFHGVDGLAIATGRLGDTDIVTRLHFGGGSSQTAGELTDVHRISICGTCSYVGDLHATRIDATDGHTRATVDHQAGIAQVDIITDADTLAIHDGVADTDQAVFTIHGDRVVALAQGNGIIQRNFNHAVLILTDLGNGNVAVTVEVYRAIRPDIHRVFTRTAQVPACLGNILHLPQLAAIDGISTGFGDRACTYPTDPGQAIGILVAQIDLDTTRLNTIAGHARATSDDQPVFAQYHVTFTDLHTVVIHHGVAGGDAALFAKVNVLGQVEGDVVAVVGLGDDDVAVGVVQVDRVAGLAVDAHVGGVFALRADVPACVGHTVDLTQLVLGRRLATDEVIRVEVAVGQAPNRASIGVDDDLIGRPRGRVGC